MKPSIIKTSRSCYFCGREVGLDRHHVFFGTANRKISDQDGLTVYLCHDCHMKLHHSPKKEWRDADKDLKRAAEYAWMKTYCPKDMDFEEKIEKFIQRYGRNYLYDD